MKKGKFTYVLIGCVILLWGIIFYRIFSALGEEDAPIVKEASRKQTYFTLVNHQKDKYILDIHYSDPFSAAEKTEFEIVVPAVPNSKVQNLQVVSAPKPQVNWDGISYAGSIYNATTRMRIIMMNIKGKEVMIKEGEEIAGVKLLKNMTDSIKVQYQNKTKILSLN